MSYARGPLGDVHDDAWYEARQAQSNALELAHNPLAFSTPQEGATPEEIRAYEADRGIEVALPGFTADSISTEKGRAAYEAALAHFRASVAGTAARVDAAWQARVAANNAMMQARGEADTAAQAEANQLAIANANRGGGVAGHVGDGPRGFNSEYTPSVEVYRRDLKEDEKNMMELQVSDAIPLNDGSLTTNLVDRYGMTVATVTRLVDGSAVADVSDSSAGFDIAGMLKKATVFLDGVAKTAQGIKTEIDRVENAGRAAVVGYRAPTTAKPYLIAGGVLVGLLVLNEVSSRRRR